MTKDIIEHLIYTNKNPLLFSSILSDCGIINDTDRIFSSCEHKELESYGINDANILLVESIYKTLYVIGEKENRICPTIKIIGNYWEFFHFGSRKLVSDILQSLNAKQFFPEPFVRKITIYTDNENFDPFNPHLEKKILPIRNNYIINDENSLDPKEYIHIKDLLLQVFT